MFLSVIRLCKDNFCGGLPGYGVVKTILDHGVDVLRRRRPFVLVNAALSIDVGDFLPDAALTCADGTDTLQQLQEVILAKNRRSLL